MTRPVTMIQLGFQGGKVTMFSALSESEVHAELKNDDVKLKSLTQGAVNIDGKPYILKDEVISFRRNELQFYIVNTLADPPKVQPAHVGIIKP